MVSGLRRSPAWRLAILLIASLIFLGTVAHNLWTLLPFAAFVLFGYAALQVIAKGWSKTQPLLLVATVVSYVWLKKYTFLPQKTFLPLPYFTLGLSYVFFRVLHLLIEANDKTFVPSSFGRYLVYCLNFTTFVSGPIQRYDEFADQFTETPIGVDIPVLAAQIERLLRGFFKVNVLALVLNIFQADAIAQTIQSTSLQQQLTSALEVAIIYPVFLYANFSGYIDIVIAIARLLNIRLPENFNRPFSASSFLDFWNRWHITLSSWLKTYVYNPLLLALIRRNSSRALEPFFGALSFFVTFFLVGVWHGRTSEFAMFGLLQGGGVATNKLWQVSVGRLLGFKRYRQLATKPIYVASSRGLTYTWFAFTLLWFWSNWTQIYELFGALGLLHWLAVWGSVWVGATIFLSAWEWIRATVLANGPMFAALTSSYARVVFATVITLVSFAVTTLIDQPAPDIVYKAF
jgi:alginate O-acetyltransferase complex protein AlgI